MHINIGSSVEELSAYKEYGHTDKQTVIPIYIPINFCLRGL